MYNSMLKVHKYQAHPWGREVWFTQDETTLRKLCKQFDLALTDFEDSNGLCWQASGSVWVLWVHPRAPAPVGVLVHECSHASLDILKYVGISAHDSSGEPMCYTLQRMVDTFLPHLLPQNS